MIGRIRLVVALACVVVSTLVLAPLQLIAMKTRLWSEWRVLRLWHRVNCRALGFRIHQHGELTDRRPLVVAANHVSWTDISVIGSRCDVSFIAKADMAAWPVMGWLARLQRTIFIERERRRTSGAQASEIAQRLAAGEAVVLFAEGTTGDGNIVLPFKSTLFGAATMAISEGAVDKVYIQPLAIAYTRVQGMPMGRRDRPLAAWIGDTELAPHAAALLREGAVDVELHFGQATEFCAGDSRKEATRLVEADVRSMLQAALGNPRPSKA
ncbi:MAG: 1-acyl-sn-glycerol-3-phosphate acyltransferase [Pseudomonadota bacterium]|nr:1-acyl-sn-glycerol-3-phosphate acyltransferase [Pseudomonadota bacterium]MDQ2705302.1 1-acyl-sn-glycerol-3-phosphate acyltransferase [Pseudomonadota bacterium]